MKKLYLLVCISIIISLNTSAQSAREVVETMIQKIEDKSGFSTMVNIEITDSINNPVATYQAQVKKQDHNFYYKLSENEIIMNDSLYVTINHAQKIVQINPRATAQDPDYMQMLGNLALKQLNTATIKEAGDDWVISLQDTRQFVNFQYRLNKNYEMKKVTYRTLDGMNVSIDYNNFSYAPSINTNDFMVAHIIDERGKLANEYQSYRLIDNVN